MFSPFDTLPWWLRPSLPQSPPYPAPLTPMYTAPARPFFQEIEQPLEPGKPIFSYFVAMVQRQEYALSPAALHPLAGPFSTYTEADELREKLLIEGETTVISMPRFLARGSVR